MKSSPNIIKMQDSSLIASIWRPGDLAPSYPGSNGSASRLAPFPGEGSPSKFQEGESPHEARAGILRSNGSSRRTSAWSPAEITGLPVAFPAAPAPTQREKVPEKTKVYKPLMDELIHQAQDQADQLAREAEARAAGIVAQAQAQAAEIRQQAHDQGIASASAEAAQLLRAARTIVDEIYAWRESVLLQSEPAVLDLVRDIARAIFGTGLELDAEVLKQTFDRALAEAKQMGNLSLRVHPDDAAQLGPQWQEAGFNNGNRRIEITPDASIRRGGCLIDGQFGLVDARVETQMQAVMELFDEIQHAHPAKSGNGNGSKP